LVFVVVIAVDAVVQPQYKQQSPAAAEHNLLSNRAPPGPSFRSVCCKLTKNYEFQHDCPIALGNRSLTGLQFSVSLLQTGRELMTAIPLPDLGQPAAG